MGSNFSVTDILSRPRKFEPDALGPNFQPPDIPKVRQIILEQARKFEPDACGLNYFVSVVHCAVYVALLQR
jgi:hypothetical protein